MTRVVVGTTKYLPTQETVKKYLEVGISYKCISVTFNSKIDIVSIIIINLLIM